MEIVRINAFGEIKPIENLTLALGNFDGFHRGHEELAIKAGLCAVGPVGILLFEQSPLESIPTTKDKGILMDLDDKIAYARKLRFDYVFVLETSKELFSLSPKEFIEKVLFPLGTKLIVAGEDYRFGKDAIGDIDYLKCFIPVFEVPLLYLKREKVSSSLIKNFIRNGEIEDAADYLGHPYELKGYVSKGLGKAQELGFRTVNIDVKPSFCLPRSGVYAAIVYLSGIPYKAMAYVGSAPTIRSDGAIKIEAHLFDYEGDAYGLFTYIDFLAFIREERKFSSEAELIKQIKADGQATIGILMDLID